MSIEQTRTDCTQLHFKFKGLGKRRVEVDFEGGDISSDGGLVLLGEMDRKMDLLDRAARLLDDPRDAARVEHPAVDLVRSRVYGIALGWEDLNDHGSEPGQGLRHDPLMQSCLGRDEPGASAATLCRMEDWAAGRGATRALNALLADSAIESWLREHGAEAVPGEIVLDFDATDDPVHGDQEGRFFHGYYRSYCFLPLHVMWGDRPMAALLRPACKDGAWGSGPVLRALVRRLRGKWPEVKIVYRADSGFCRWRVLSWCEDNGVDYVVGLARNPALARLSDRLMEQAADLHGQTGDKVRLFEWIDYEAGTWDRSRRVIAKAEHSGEPNPRYVVTTLEGDAQEIYDEVYCARGDMENRIKEQQLDLFSGRTSCTDWWSNQFRLLLSVLAYVLVAEIRRTGLADTVLASAQAGTIRLKLLKVGAVVLRNTRRIRVHLSSCYPYREVFEAAARRIRGLDFAPS